MSHRNLSLRAQGRWADVAIHILKSLCRDWLRSVRAQWPFYLCVIALAVLCWKLWGTAPKDLGTVLRAIEKAHAGGGEARVEDYAQAWLPRVARVHFFVCCALLVVGPWLVGRERAERSAARSQSSRWLWIVTGVMIATSAWLNCPRLSHSFWADEEWTAQRLVIGGFRDESEFRVPSWTKTLFYYHNPNNHPLFSALARLSHSMVPAPQGKDEFYFREWAIRLPAFLFGMGGLAALAWLAGVMGMPRAGMIAVAWLALHPWHVRYGVDARGYALLLTLLPLTMGFLWRAIATGGMSWWLAYGLAEFLVLWAYPGALYFVVVLNVIACGMLATGAAPISRWLQWRRFSAANLIGAMLTSLMLSPCVQPMMLYLKTSRIRGELSTDWVMETLSGLFTGMPWAKWPDHDMALAWMRTWDQAPWFVILTLAVLALTLVAGTIAMWRAGSMHRWLAGLSLITGPFMFIMAKGQGNILYPWYLIVCLPGIAMIMGAGVEALATRFFAGRHRQALPVGFLALFGAVTWPQNQLLRSHSIEQMRESVAVMRPERNALTADMGKVLTASLTYPARLYDPAAEPVGSAAELRSLMDRADAKGLPLWVNFGDIQLLRLRDPALLVILDDASQFQAMPPFPGIHGQYGRWVYRYLGKGVH